MWLPRLILQIQRSFVLPLTLYLCCLLGLLVILKFEKDSGYEVKEVKVTVVYVVPPKPPSPVQEGSDENLSPQASVFSDKVFLFNFFKAVRI